MNHFTPISALAGGLLIGLAAILLLALNGRIAGVSGVAGGLFFGRQGDWGWRVLFLIGLVVGAAGYVALTGIALLIGHVPLALGERTALPCLFRVSSSVAGAGGGG